jgi:hypothetical protein
LNAKLVLRADPADFEAGPELQLPVVGTGENGWFTKGEFEAITSLGQMEFLTPEEIADICVREIGGASTGYDVVAALDASVMNPTYRAGVLRTDALAELQRLEEETGTHSVALGQLGPPELSKLLWEAELIKLAYGTLPAVLAVTAEEISTAICALLEERPRLRDTITSLGLPILTRDGSSIIRGPRIRIPELAGQNEVAVDTEAMDRWAAKGWVDLRPPNFARWQQRFQAMRMARAGKAQRGSAGVTLEAYVSEDITIGTIAAWILTNELGGYRVK